MAIGTIFTLLVIPSIYVLLAKQHAGEEPGALAHGFDLGESARQQQAEGESEETEVTA